MNDLPQPDSPSANEQSAPGAPECRHTYLWTPWRMAYAAGASDREEGCIFCNRLASLNDVANLILFRDDHVFSIMNLYPYNTGHLMVVPNRHASSPETLDEASLTALALEMQRSLCALRTALDCEGFNVGLNIGTSAGAGVADHLHQHIVPRWTGDANFMQILSGTMVMPELLSVTYAKVRAELFRIQQDSHPVTICCVDQSGDRIAMDTSGTTPKLPEVVPVDGEPLWRTAHRFLDASGIEGQLSGWGGSISATAGQRSGFSFAGRTVGDARSRLQFTATDEAIHHLRDCASTEMILQAKALVGQVFAPPA